MSRPAKIVLALALLALSAACLVAPSRLGASRPSCKRCTPPPPPETSHDMEIE